MLNYQSTSFHDAAAVRRIFGLRPAPEFAAWLEERGIFRGGHLAPADAVPRERLLGYLTRLMSSRPA
jgi:ethanolamine ammonia-lyase large subunit